MYLRAVLKVSVLYCTRTVWYLLAQLNIALPKTILVLAFLN